MRNPCYGFKISSWESKVVLYPPPDPGMQQKTRDQCFFGEPFGPFFLDGEAQASKAWGSRGLGWRVVWSYSTVSSSQGPGVTGWGWRLRVSR